jgi:molybdate transport system substrate-binding protein
VIRRIAAVGATLLLLAGCGGNAEPASTTSPDTAPASTAETTQSDQQVSGTLNVFAAASLKATFEELGEMLMAENPDLNVEFVFAGSSDLVAQLEAGAPGDVFASADERNMTKATDAELMEPEPTPFVTNHLTIAVAPGNPLGITSLADLENPDLNVVVCAPQVPCGGATEQVAELADVTLTPVSEEPSVSNVLTKVTSGEADAGLVYRTDARGAGDKVTAVDFPEADEVINVYPIGMLTDSQNPEAAQAFIDLVLSAEGQQVLADAGFNSAN